MCRNRTQAKGRGGIGRSLFHRFTWYIWQHGLRTHRRIGLRMSPFRAAFYSYSWLHVLTCKQDTSVQQGQHVWNTANSNQYIFCGGHASLVCSRQCPKSVTPYRAPLWPIIVPRQTVIYRRRYSDALSVRCGCPFENGPDSDNMTQLR